MRDRMFGVGRSALLTVMRPACVALVATLVAGCAHDSASVNGKPQPAARRVAAEGAMDRNRLLVGAYYLTANLHDDPHVKEVADAGIDFLVAVDAKTNLLDLCAKHGVGVIAHARFPSWWGGDGKNAGKYGETLPLDKLDAALAKCGRHPALWGDYPVDEPNAHDFAHVNAVAKRYEAKFPGQLAFVNLYPIYANTAPSGIAPELQKAPSQLGTASYQEHIDRYVREVDTDYICFDSYPFTGPFAGYLENLDIVGKACRASGRDLWVIIQSGAWKPENVLGEFQIRWQACLCLAYGANVIMHASYSPGWWNETTSCVNKAGEKNATYGYVQHVNAELHALSDVFMRYQSLGVYPCGNIAGAGTKMVKQLEAQRTRNGDALGRAERRLLEGIETDGAAVAGLFRRRDGGGYAVMLVNAQDPWDAHAAINVDLKLKGSVYVKGCKTALGPHLKLDSGEGVFITVK